MVETQPIFYPEGNSLVTRVDPGLAFSLFGNPSAGKKLQFGASIVEKRDSCLVVGDSRRLLKTFRRPFLK